MRGAKPFGQGGTGYKSSTCSRVGLRSGLAFILIEEAGEGPPSEKIAAESKEEIMSQAGKNHLFKLVISAPENPAIRQRNGADDLACAVDR